MYYKGAGKGFVNYIIHFHIVYILHSGLGGMQELISGAPNDDFLLNALKSVFKLSEHSYISRSAF